jgi:hypothetical protein
LTTKAAGGVAAFIATAAPRPTKQKRANHIVLVILDPNLPSGTGWELIFKTEFGPLGGNKDTHRKTARAVATGNAPADFPPVPYRETKY